MMQKGNDESIKMLFLLNNYSTILNLISFKEWLKEYFSHFQISIPTFLFQGKIKHRVY